MNIIITNNENKVIACVPIENDEKGILLDGYNAYKIDNPGFSDKNGEVLFYPSE